MQNSSLIVAPTLRKAALTLQEQPDGSVTLTTEFNPPVRQDEPESAVAGFVTVMLDALHDALQEARDGKTTEGK